MTPQPSVEFRVGASPTVPFALMLRTLYLSLQRYAGLERFELTVFVGTPSGQEAETAAFAEWLAPEMRCVVLDPAEFDVHGIHATADLRLQAPATADVVVCIDADMVVCGDLGGLAADIRADPAAAGVIAHVGPFPRDDWEALHARLDMAPPEFPYRYSGWPYLWGKQNRRPGVMQAPPYFNYGFVAMTGAILDRIAAHHRPATLAVAEMFPGNMFRSQVSLTLAIALAGVPHRTIGMRYNFANDIAVEALYPDELKELRVLHLLRRNENFDKQKVYASLDALRAFAASGWETAGGLERARRIIEEVLPEIEARPLPAALADPNWIW